MRLAFAGNEAKRPVPAGMSDAEKRLAFLRERGIDRQVVGGWLDMFGYDLPPEEGADWSRFLNDQMLKGVATLPAFVPLATVPLQSGKLAAQVLGEAQYRRRLPRRDDRHATEGRRRRARRSRPRSVLGGRLGAQAVLFVHPTFGARDDRLKAYGLVSAVGRVTDTTTAMARLLYSGHLMRYPGASLVISHGGAALAMVLGRMRQSTGR